MPRSNGSAPRRIAERVIGRLRRLGDEPPSRGAMDSLALRLASLTELVAGLSVRIDAQNAQLTTMTDVLRAIVHDVERAAMHAQNADLRSIYEAMAAVGAQHPQLVPLTGGLGRYERRVFSQNGEDGVLAEIIRRLDAEIEPSFVEFGAGNGLENNCALLADVMGWSGVFLEAEPENFARLNSKYANNTRVQTIQAIVTAEAIDELLQTIGVSEYLGILSIDIDGQDWWVWRALRLVRPAVVVIEYNSALDASSHEVQPWDPQWVYDRTSYFGCSLGAMSALADTKGYRLVHTDTTGVNAFFVRDDLMDRFADVGGPIARSPNWHFEGHGHDPDPRGRMYVDALSVLAGDDTP